MSQISRKTVRFKDFGRVDAPDISLLPGVLEDISLQGCKVRFPLSLTVDSDNDYELKIHTSRKQNSVPLSLVCHPQWSRGADGGTEIGFQILRSPDTAKLSEYINQLSADDDTAESFETILTDPLCQFV